MQIDGGYFKVAMAEQYLDGAQVGAGFKKMSRETMSQSVGMNAPVVEAGAFGSDLAGRPEDLGGDRWDEKAGLRRDALSSQVIDALEGA